MTSFGLLSLNNDVNVPSKSNKQKNDENSQDPDPDPHQNVKIRNTAERDLV